MSAVVEHLQTDVIKNVFVFYVHYNLNNKRFVCVKYQIIYFKF